MILTHDGEKFVLVTGYRDFQDHAERIKGAGFRWNSKTKQWLCGDPEKAALLIEYADNKTREMLSDLSSKQRQAIAASRASFATLQHDLLREPFPFQKAGISRLLDLNRALNADDPGLGKTIQSLAVVHMKRAYPCLVVCPSSVKINWMREAEDTCTELREEGSILIMRGRAPTIPPESMWAEWAKAKVWVINYQILATWVPLLQRVPFRSIIFDEFQFCKNAKAGWSKAAEDISAGIAMRHGLTGTPILNRPRELVHPLKILGLLSIFGTEWDFFMRYCNAHKEPIWTRDAKGKAIRKFVWNFDGASNLEELQRKLRSNCMVRRLKSEVLTELPPKRHQVIELPSDSVTKLIARENELAKRVGLDAMNFSDAVVNIQKYYKAEFSEMSKLRHDIAMAKLPMCIDHHIETLDTVNKLVIFAHHHDVIDTLYSRLQSFGPVKLTGNETDTQRQKAIDEFTKGDARVFLGSIKAAGVGINLQVASLCQFDELDWTPGWMDQAIDRLCRIGQLFSVLAQYLVLEGSLDCKMIGTLVRKGAIAYAALDKPLTDFSKK